MLPFEFSMDMNRERARERKRIHSLYESFCSVCMHISTLNWVINHVHLLAYDCDDEYLTILGWFSFENFVFVFGLCPFISVSHSHSRSCLFARISNLNRSTQPENTLQYRECIVHFWDSSTNSLLLLLSSSLFLLSLIAAQCPSLLKLSESALHIYSIGFNIVVGYFMTVFVLKENHSC